MSRAAVPRKKTAIDPKVRNREKKSWLEVEERTFRLASRITPV